MEDRSIPHDHGHAANVHGDDSTCKSLAPDRQRRWKQVESRAQPFSATPKPDAAISLRRKTLRCNQFFQPGYTASGGCFTNCSVGWLKRKTTPAWVLPLTYGAAAAKRSASFLLVITNGLSRPPKNRHRVKRVAGASHGQLHLLWAHASDRFEVIFCAAKHDHASEL